MANESRQIFFRFYGRLNDFLPPDRRHRTFGRAMEQRRSIKDAIESVGVPHTEIDLIVVGDRSVAFSYLPDAGDRIAVYPPFFHLDVQALSLVRPAPLDVPRFVLDGHLGRLAAYLRLAGLDCLYSNSWDDDRLAVISGTEKRILLSRDVALLKRSVVQYGSWVRNTEPRRQLAEVAARFDLRYHVQPFSRCAHCNTPLQVVSKAVVLEVLPPRTRQLHDEFKSCRECGRIYWKGGHYRKILSIIQESLAEGRR